MDYDSQYYNIYDYFNALSTPNTREIMAQIFVYQSLEYMYLIRIQWTTK